MADAPQEELRRRPRVAHRLLVRYQPPVEGAAEWLVSPLRDLSSGGARFLSEHPFAMGETFDLQQNATQLRDLLLERYPSLRDPEREPH